MHAAMAVWLGCVRLSFPQSDEMANMAGRPCSPPSILPPRSIDFPSAICLVHLAADEPTAPAALAHVHMFDRFRRRPPAISPKTVAGIKDRPQRPLAQSDTKGPAHDFGLEHTNRQRPRICRRLVSERARRRSSLCTKKAVAIGLDRVRSTPSNRTWWAAACGARRSFNAPKNDQSTLYPQFA